MINVRNWRFSFNSLFCHRFPLEDVISMCLRSSHKTWPLFHSDAEWISTPWKGRNLWDAQSTQHPCQPSRPLPWGVMASGCHWDCFACPWNATPQPGGEATSPSEAVKSSWKWADQLLPAFQEWALQHKGRCSERLMCLPCSPCCHAGLLGSANVAACLS